MVKPSRTRATEAGVKCIFSFLLLWLGTKGGKGRNTRQIPSTIMIAALTRNSVEKGSRPAATNRIPKGSRNWAMEMESFVKILAMVPFSLKISMQEGVMLVSRKEFAMPLTIAST